MSKIVYFIGAGASAHSIPIVKDIPYYLDQYRQDLQEFLDGLEDRQANYDHIETCSRMIHQITDLIENIDEGRSSSIDTFAKRLYLTNQGVEYLGLKHVLACFLTWLQFVKQQLDPDRDLKGNLDMRYDTFFASILDQHIEDFKAPITIISWNYDWQFELAFSNYSQTHNLPLNRLRLGVKDQGETAYASEQFNILKLNGAATFVHDSKFVEVNEYDRKTFFNNLLRTNRSVTRIQFAWEQNIKKNLPSDNSVLRAARDCLLNAEAIVFIGYSLPFFNVDIDSYILQTLRDRISQQESNEALIDFNVYIQDKEPAVIWQKLKNLVPIPESNVGFISSIDQFYLPPALYAR